MSRAAALRLLVLATVAALVARVVRNLRGPEAPVFSAPSSTQALFTRTSPSDEPAEPGREPTDPADERGDGTGPTDNGTDQTATTDLTGDLPDQTDDLTDQTDDASAETGDGSGGVEEVTTRSGAATRSGDGEPKPPGERWEFPVDGECPPSHPIKAKLRSGIYHLPGMMAYDRAKPDRCYATEVDARADGLRRAKR